jgi:hypothetical protein
MSTTHTGLLAPGVGSRAGLSLLGDGRPTSNARRHGASRSCSQSTRALTKASAQGLQKDHKVRQEQLQTRRARACWQIVAGDKEGMKSKRLAFRGGWTRDVIRLFAYRCWMGFLGHQPKWRGQVSGFVESAGMLRAMEHLVTTLTGFTIVRTTPAHIHAYSLYLEPSEEYLPRV